MLCALSCDKRDSVVLTVADAASSNRIRSLTLKCKQIRSVRVQSSVSRHMWEYVALRFQFYLLRMLLFLAANRHCHCIAPRLQRHGLIVKAGQSIRWGLTASTAGRSDDGMTMHLVSHRCTPPPRVRLTKPCAAAAALAFALLDKKNLSDCGAMLALMGNM